MSKKHERNFNRFAHKMLMTMTVSAIALETMSKETFESDNSKEDKLLLLKEIQKQFFNDVKRVIKLMNDAESAEEFRFSKKDMSLSLDKIEEIFKAAKEEDTSESKDESLKKVEDELIEILEKILGVTK